MEGRGEERNGAGATRLMSTPPADATRAATPAGLGRVFSACRYDGWAGRATREGWANVNRMLMLYTWLWATISV